MNKYMAGGQAQGSSFDVVERVEGQGSSSDEPVSTAAELDVDVLLGGM